MKLKIYHFKSLNSTQDKAKEFAKKGLKNIVIVADVQTKGRGRFKRKWHSAKGGLWMSILLKPNTIENLQYLTFATAISVVRSIRRITCLNTKIKWPNDIHYKGKKICGILTEGIFGRENYAVVGIGVNANQSGFPEDIESIAASLKMINGKSINIKKLMNCITKEFFILYNNYTKRNYARIIKNFKKYCDTLGKDVEVTTITKRLRGKAIGIDKECNLLLKTSQNKIIKIFEGDVSIRY